MFCLIRVVRGGEHERQTGISQNVICSRITDSDPDRIPRGSVEILDDTFYSDDPIDAIPVAYGTDCGETCRIFRAERREITFCGLDDEHGLTMPPKLTGFLLGLYVHVPSAFSVTAQSPQTVIFFCALGSLARFLILTRPPPN